MAVWSSPVFLGWEALSLYFMGLEELLMDINAVRWNWRRKRIDSKFWQSEMSVVSLKIYLSRSPRKVWRNEETGWPVLIGQSELDKY